MTHLLCSHDPNLALRDHHGNTVFHLIRDLQGSKDKQGWNPDLDQIEQFLMAQKGAAEAAALEIDVTGNRDAQVQAV